MCAFTKCVPSKKKSTFQMKQISDVFESNEFQKKNFKQILMFLSKFQSSSKNFLLPQSFAVPNFSDGPTLGLCPRT